MSDNFGTRRSRIAAVVLALLAIASPTAYADGDPASDVLPSQDAHYPYQPPVSRELVTALDGLLAKVRKGGYPMKVALIQTAGDLGSLAALMNDAQRYTNVLASELPANPHGKVKDELHLLVHPIAVSSGKRLFETETDRIPLKLVSSKTLSTGVLALTYAHA